MTHKINTSRTAAVSPVVHWLPIDSNTPRGVKLQLIAKSSGIAMYGNYYDEKCPFYSHWAPLPAFATDVDQPRFEYLDQMTNNNEAAKIGDVWHRVDGSHPGDEAYDGMELAWTAWVCIKTTARGAWFKCVEWSSKKPRFALTSGARAICRTKNEALERLVARKLRHLQILNSEIIFAKDTLDAAQAAFAKANNIGISK